MVNLKTGDSVYVLLRFTETTEDDDGPGIEVHAIYSSEDAAGCYLDELEEKGVNTDDFEIIERALDVDPSSEE